MTMVLRARDLAAAFGAAALALGAPAAALAQTEGATAAEAPAVEEKVLESYDAATPLATFDGGSVTLGDLIAERRDLGGAVASNMSDEEVYKQLLERIERRKLLAEAARKEGLDADPDVKRRVEAAVAAVLSQAYLEKNEADAASEEEIRALYDELVETMPMTVETRTRHILLKTEAEAKAVKAELDGGADFALLAAQKSEGPSKTNGGDLGFVPAGQLVPAYEAAAAALKPGEISDPVQTRFGWNVIKLAERRTARQAPP